MIIFREKKCNSYIQNVLLNLKYKIITCFYNEIIHWLLKAVYDGWIMSEKNKK